MKCPVRNCRDCELEEVALVDVETRDGVARVSRAYSHPDCHRRARFVVDDDPEQDTTDPVGLPVAIR